MKACILANHLYEPLISANRGAAISIAPVALNESETTFVTALMGWLAQHEAGAGHRNVDLPTAQQITRQWHWFL